MGYRLKAKENVDEGVKRIIVEQIDAARAELAGADRVEAVHQLRKRCKKIRAALRLVRAALGDDYTQENLRFRDMGRDMAASRDAHVLVETFDGLMHACDADIDRRHYAPLRPKLVAMRDVALAPDLDAGLRQLDGALLDARRATERWQLDRSGFAALRGGFDQTYVRARRAMQHAFDTGESLDFHEWRKRVKYHRYHCDLLRNLWPAAVKVRVKALHRLSDLLGEDHDLAVLAAVVADPAHDLLQSANESALLKLIEARRRALRQQARPLGARLFAERKKALRRRFQCYWRVWRD